jgi:cbb3-type cytochrome oxidase maturation protein
MEILYLLIPLSIVLVFAIAGIFWWSVKNGQFEDLEGPGYRILMDDDKTAIDQPATRNEFDPSQKPAKTKSTE